jgi:hypothetical protein
MPTPYDNHDGGFTRADRKIAANYGIDLDAPEQVRCDSCNKLFEADELNGVMVEQAKLLARLQKNLGAVTEVIESAEKERLHQSREKPPHYAP